MLRSVGYWIGDRLRDAGYWVRDYWIPLAGVVVLLSAGAAAYLLFIKSEETCVSRLNGDEVECDSSYALSQEEYDAQQARERREKQQAQEEAAKCESQLADFLSALRELDSRLDVGLTYVEYSAQVGDVNVAYDQIPFDQLGTDCTIEAGVPSEDALNSYAKAVNIWDKCVSDFGCDTDTIDPELQAKWLDASTKLSEAERGLNALAQP